MTELQIISSVLCIAIACACVAYTVPETIKSYFLHKENMMQENMKLPLLEEQTKQEQIKVALAIAEKEKEVEKTKQLEIKLEAEKNNLYLR